MTHIIMRYAVPTRFARLAIPFALTLFACGKDPLPSGPGGGGGGGGGATTNQININDNSFAPASTTVTTGTTITWTWQNTANQHNVTFPSGTNSTNMSTGTFQRGFPTAGTFTYSCTNHPGMNGTIIVQ